MFLIELIEPLIFHMRMDQHGMFQKEAKFKEKVSLFTN